MANSTQGFGLKPIYRKDGAPIRPNPTLYEIPSTVTVPIYPGDPVIKDGDGKIGIYVAAGATGLTGVVAQVFDSNKRPLPDADSSGASLASTGSTTRYCTLYDEDNVFIAREDSDSESIAQASVNLNFDLVAQASNAGNNPPGDSGWLIDSSSKATTATHPVRLIGFAESDAEDSNVPGTDDNKVCLVIINDVQGAA